uniref:Uncharacterized protein n=1 Tax=Aegilops tauschii subsp. strangulata TaxID=200361 RepID=A0A453AVP4_AEGTS
MHVAGVVSAAPRSTQGGPDRPAVGSLHDAGVGKLESLADLGSSFSGARIPYSSATLASTPAMAAALQALGPGAAPVDALPARGCCRLQVRSLDI